MSRRTRPMMRLPTLGAVWRAALLLALGVVVTVAFSWGAIFWRVCVSRPFLNAGEGMPASVNDWPLPAPEAWPERPQYVQVARDFGYERRIAKGSQHLLRRADVPDAPWLDANSGGHSTLQRERAREVVRLRQLARDRLNGAGGDRSATEMRTAEALSPMPPTEHRVAQYEVFRRRSGFPFRCMESSWREWTRNTYTQGVQGPQAINAPSPAFAGLSSSPPASPDGRDWTWLMHYHRGIPWPQHIALPNAAGSRFNLPLKPVWPMFVVNVLVWAAGPAALLRWRRWRSTRRRVGRGLCPRCAYPIGVSGVCSECGANLPIRANSYSAAASSP